MSGTQNKAKVLTIIGLSFLSLIYNNCSKGFQMDSSSRSTNLYGDYETQNTLRDSRSGDDSNPVTTTTTLPSSGGGGPSPSCHPGQDLVAGSCRDCFGAQSGDGSASSPFRISSCKCLQVIGYYQSQPNTYYELTQDLDCSSKISLDPTKYEGFSPIMQFQATLNGKGHTIRNLTLRHKSVGQSQIYFGAMFFDLKGTIKNLKFDGAHIEVISPREGNSNLEGTASILSVGDAFNGAGAKIENIEVKNSEVVGQYQAACIATYFRGDVENVSCSNTKIKALSLSQELPTGSGCADKVKFVGRNE